LRSLSTIFSEFFFASIRAIETVVHRRSRGPQVGCGEHALDELVSWLRMTLSLFLSPLSRHFDTTFQGDDRRSRGFAHRHVDPAARPDYNAP